MLILLGLSPFAAVFGSVVIGFSTYIPIIIGAGHNAKFLAYIYIPWIYIGYLKSVKDKKINYAGLFIFALALALHLRAYHPQVTYMFLFPLLTLFMISCAHGKRTGWRVSACRWPALQQVQQRPF